MMNEDLIRCEIARMGLKLEIKNQREHWIFRATGLTWGYWNQPFAEWWPSTGRLVFRKQWKRTSMQMFHAEDVLAKLWQKIPIHRPVLGPLWPEKPAYIQRVKELVE